MADPQPDTLGARLREVRGQQHPPNAPVAPTSDARPAPPPADDRELVVPLATGGVLSWGPSGPLVFDGGYCWHRTPPPPTTKPDTIVFVAPLSCTEAEREAWLLGHIVELRRLVGTAVDRLAELEERLSD